MIWTDNIAEPGTYPGHQWVGKTAQERNEAVALRLGWKQESYEWQPGVLHWVGPAGEFTMPDYCRKIEAAWEIVGYLLGQHLTVMVSVQEGFGHHCTIQEAGGRLLSVQKADATPMAICLAFLELP